MKTELMPLRKTEYFPSGPHSIVDLEYAIKESVQKRDSYLKNNIDRIETILEEDIKVVSFSNQGIAVIIKLCYYLKPNQE